MGLLVQKFGGTAVGDPERIRAVADHIARTVNSGNQVVVVVSAIIFYRPYPDRRLSRC